MSKFDVIIPAKWLEVYLERGLVHDFSTAAYLYANAYQQHGYYGLHAIYPLEVPNPQHLINRIDAYICANYPAFIERGQTLGIFKHRQRAELEIIDFKTPISGACNE